MSSCAALAICATAAVAQMASAAQELTNLSLELQTVVSRFRLG